MKTSIQGDMEKSSEFGRLFIKFIDNTINEQELELFYSHIKRGENDQEILPLLTELYDYMQSIKDM